MRKASILGLMLFDAWPLWLGLVGFAIVFAVVARAIEERRNTLPQHMGREGDE